MQRLIIHLLVLGLFFSSCMAAKTGQDGQLLTGADQSKEWKSILQHKRVGLVANATSRVGERHLVDTMLSSGINVRKVFSPEHGFRGEAEAGEHVSSGTDERTGLPIVSLYGDHKKPVKEDLAELDIVVFDIQDVGARFYTYINTLQYLMEACAEYDLPLLLLDRPNPNGGRIDGPLLDTAYRSFVGLQPIPVLYGMTIGEYAQMLNGEGWLSGQRHCQLTVVKLKNWNHHTAYTLPVKPSPNLPNDLSVQLYPSLCFFEGANVSLGRGTELPFQVYGYPGNPTGDFEFTPKAKNGSTIKPPFDGQLCKGYRLSEKDITRNIELKWLLSCYQSIEDKSRFFIPFFEKIAGTDKLRKQIEAGLTAEEIRESWQPDLIKFKAIRQKYLLYAE